MEVPHLPKGTGWPRGWWRSRGGFGCCGKRCRWKRFPKGVLMFLTGADGEVLCMAHVVARGERIPASV